jgi:hypothetical protein
MIPKLPDDVRARLLAWEDRALSRDEFEARAAVPMSEHEREDFHDLVRWFKRRYPTAGERLRVMRRRLLQLRQRSR